MIPVRDPESPLERWIAKGVIERAEDDGSVLEIDPYPGGSGGTVAALSSRSRVSVMSEIRRMIR
jgi:hypothetical protein